MGAFELQDTEQAELMRYSGHGKIKDECVIVFKVYDNCRSLLCNIIRRRGRGVRAWLKNSYFPLNEKPRRRDSCGVL